MRLPLRLRLTLSFALGMTIVLGSLGAFLYLRLGSQLLRSIDGGLRSRAAVIAAGIGQQGANFGDAPGKLIDPRAAFAQVLGSSGEIIETSSAVAGAPLVPATTLRSVRGPTLLDGSLPGSAVSVRLLALPVHESGHTLFVVAGASLASREEALSQLLLLFVVGGPAALALTSSAGWFLAGAALRPVERMRREAAAISASEWHRRLPVPPERDEIGRLGETLNAMLDRLQQAIERERRLVDDASHELRTPLGALKVQLEVALRRPRSAEELEAALRGALLETDRLVRLAEDLLVLARTNNDRLPVHRERVSVGELLRRTAGLYEPRARGAGVQVRVNAADDSVLLDPTRVRQAVGNLIDNALRHTRPGGDVTISAEPADESVRIVVEDSGTGFDEAILDRAFEPFTRGPREHERAEGAGLGLAIVRAIAEAHGGRVEATNKPTGGARVAMELRARPA